MKNKKLIASLTLAGFMATGLVPSVGLLDVPAIYAAGAPSLSASYVETEDANPEVDTKEDVTVKVGLLDKDNQTTSAETDYKVYLWAEKNNNIIDDALSAKTGQAGVTDNDKGVLTIDPGAAEKKIDINFSRAGKYTIHAAYIEDGSQAHTDLENNKITSDVEAREISRNSEKGVITVSAKTTVKAFKIDNSELVLVDHAAATPIALGNTNGIAKKKFKVTVFSDAAGTKSVGRGMKVNLETSSNNVELKEKSVTTDNSGSVDVEFTATAQGDYKIYVNADGNEITVPVKISSSNVDRMVLVKTPTAPIATTEVDKVATLEDYVRIEFRDGNGSLLKGVTQEVINGTDGYVKVVEKPAKSKVEAKDFKVVAVGGKDYYTIRSAKDLVAGKYTLRLATDNGKTVDVSFEVAEFSKAQSLKLEYDTETVAIGKTMPKADVYFVDEKGVKKTAKNVNLGYSGYAVNTFNYTDGSFTVKNDEKYLGSKITVTAVADRQNLVSVAEITVAQDGRGLKFATNSGVINSNNQVDFQIVDGAGKSVGINTVSSVNAVILSSSNKDAKVSANFSTGDVDAAKGTGKLFVTSDKPSTVEVQVFVRDNLNQYYASTLTYTFSETGANANVNRFVVMSINSDMANVNNTNVKIDAAPIVKMNRTFVPLRVIAEAFGAEVGYDEKTKEVTVKNEGKTLKLVQDDKKLMINDKEKVMDVAPFISNARVMVPVRFVAEELGFKVSAVRDAKKGGTAAVVFSR